MAEKHPGGRPATGQTPVRTMRIGAIWDQAKATADRRGEKITQVVEAALRRYVARHATDPDTTTTADQPADDEAPRP